MISNNYQALDKNIFLFIIIISKVKIQMSMHRPMVALRDQFYNTLINDHGFQQAATSRIPGTVSAVTRDEVEVTALAFDQTEKPEDSGVRVDVRIPVNSRPDEFFATLSCGGREYLGQRRDIILRSVGDIADQINIVLDLVQRGSAILQLCGNEPHPILERKTFR